MRAVLALCLLLVACGPVDTKSYVAHLGFTAGNVCSGTFVGPGLILTAHHCFSGGAVLLTVNHQPVNVLSHRHDGADHALVLVDYANPVWAVVHIAHVQGQPVHMYGNPAKRTDLYRSGYISGWDAHVVYVDMVIGAGDSGAGVFDERGRLVGVVMGYGEQGAFHMGLLRHLSPEFLP